eukprot:1229406-Rhodomonas_salina.2
MGCEMTKEKTEDTSEDTREAKGRRTFERDHVRLRRSLASCSRPKPSPSECFPRLQTAQHASALLPSSRTARGDAAAEWEL